MTSNTEKLEILMKPKLTVRDIEKLLGVGSRKASAIATEFRRWYESEFDSQWYGIPTGLFAERYNISELRIMQLAEAEKKMRK